MQNSSLPLSSFLDSTTLVDDDLPKGTLLCEPVRIHYNAPDGTGDPINELVHIDARDSTWEREDASLLLVPTSAVHMLHKRLDDEKRWTGDTISTIDLCRHDYLREHSYLMDEINSLVQRAERAARRDAERMGNVPSTQDSGVGTKQPSEPVDLRSLAPNERLAIEFRAFSDSAVKFSEAAAEDIEGVVPRSDAQMIAEAAGPRTSRDEDFVYYMRKAGITTEDELSIRIMLKRMREGCGAALAEKQRLAKLVDTLEAGSTGATATNFVDSLFSQALKEGGDLKEIIAEIRSYCDAKKAAEVEDIITNCVRERYARLVQTEEQAVQDTMRWRQKLAQMEEQAARILRLKDDAQRAEEKQQEYEMSVRAKHMASEEARKRRRLIASMAGQSQLLTDSDIVDAMSELQREEMAEWENTIATAKVKEMGVMEQIRKLENVAFAGIESPDELEEGIQEAEDRIATVEHEIGEYEERVSERKAEIVDAKAELKQANKDLQKAQDLYDAANVPPPPNGDLKRLQKLHEMKLAEEEAAARKYDAIEQKYEFYEEKYQEADNAIRAREEEEAAAELMRRLQRLGESSLAEKEIVQVKLKEPLDPALLPYHQRVLHPEYKDLARDNNLNSDSRCMDKRMAKQRREKAEAEADGLLARMRKGVSVTNVKTTEYKTPINFRRPEDLKVRLIGAEKAVGHIEGAISSTQPSERYAAAQLRALGGQLRDSASESQKLHTVGTKNLAAAVQRGDLVDNGGDGINEEDRRIRADLLDAFENHQSCNMESAAAWRLAEDACERGETETELSLEEQACAAREAALIVAYKALYSQAILAAARPSPRLAGAGQRCCMDLEEVEGELAAAAAARNAAWPRVLAAASMLDKESKLQRGLGSMLREKDRNRNLLAAEIVAPAGVKRALWKMRSAQGGGDGPLHAGDGVIPASAETPEARAQALASILTAKSVD